MDHHNNNVTAIILAGGLGRRLHGRDKGLVSLQGKTLIERAITRLKSQTQHILINANQNFEQYQLSGYPVVQDIFSDNQGPLAGILSCGAHIKTSMILTVPCDTPLLPKNLLATMLRAYELESKPHLCVANDGERMQNLFMLFHIERLNDLSKFFNHDNRKVNDWIQGQNYREVYFPQQTLQFTNINTEKTLNFLEKKLKNDAEH